MTRRAIMAKNYNTPKSLLKDLSKYNLCYKEVIDYNEANQYADEDDVYVDIQGGYYLCSLDKFTDTRLLIGIFKCVNFMKNVLVAGLVCGGIGVLILAISLIGK